MTFGLIPTDRSRINAPVWVLAIFGCTFVAVGLWAILLRAIRQDTAEANWINFLFVLLVMLAISVICLWVGFGPGQRLFAGTGVITDPTLGRIFFGFFGVLMTAVTFTFAVIRVRKLL